MSEFKVEGSQFTINGRPLFLRGTLECAIFPKTGYPPTEIELILDRLQSTPIYGGDILSGDKLSGDDNESGQGGQIVRSGMTNCQVRDDKLSGNPLINQSLTIKVIQYILMNFFDGQATHNYILYYQNLFVGNQAGDWVIFHETKHQINWLKGRGAKYIGQALSGLIGDPVDSDQFKWVILEDG